MNIFRQIYVHAGMWFLHKIFKLSNGIAGVQDAYYREIFGAMIHREIDAKYEKLVQNVDENSRQIVRISIEHLIEGMTVRNGRYSSLSPEQIQNLPLYNVEKKQYSQTKLKPKEYLPEVFYYHHGLRNCNPLIHKYIQGKCFVDCGAYIGDSAIVLAKYEPKQIYCFEFSKPTIQLLQKNIKRNHLESKIVLFQNALGKSESFLRLHTSVDAGCSILQSEDTCNTAECVTVKKLDDCIPATSTVGFIKADVEGALLDVLEGARSTIQKDRPVLSLAVYHSPQELFEGKPYLESFLEDYIYEFHHLNFSQKFLSELTLFAYPKEILSK